MKQRVKIMTVDPSTRSFEFLDKGGALVQGQVWEVPSFFRWPKQSEYWTVTRVNNVWTLGDRMEDVNTEFPVEQLAEGEAKVNASRVIRTDDGSQVAVVTGTPQDGQVPIWDEDEGSYVPGAGGGAEGPPGPANELSIGTVTTGAAGTSAAATITGEAPDQILNLTIPRGDTGATATSATYETSLPSSPTDGDEIFFAADPTNSILWHLRWRAAVSRWEFLGGPPWQALATGTPTTSSATLTTLTGGPSITVPVAGLYVIQFSAAVDASAINTAILGPRVGSADPTDNVDTAKATVAGVAYAASLGHTTKKSAAANDVIQLVYGSTGTMTWRTRSMSITPVYVT